jgi:hypothetical protein
VPQQTGNLKNKREFCGRIFFTEVNKAITWNTPSEKGTDRKDSAWILQDEARKQLLHLRSSPL